MKTQKVMINFDLLQYNLQLYKTDKIAANTAQNSINVSQSQALII
jgi:hypothetical protein